MTVCIQRICISSAYKLNTVTIIIGMTMLFHDGIQCLAKKVMTARIVIVILIMRNSSMMVIIIVKNDD